MAENIIYEYKRVGYHFRLFPNRIEYREPSPPFGHKDSTILLRSITSVAVAGVTKGLQITLNSGDVIKISIFHKDAEKTKAAILSQL